jgi:hypothetical protein
MAAFDMQTMPNTKEITHKNIDNFFMISPFVAKKAEPPHSQGNSAIIKKTSDLNGK